MKYIKIFEEFKDGLGNSLISKYSEFKSLYLDGLKDMYGISADDNAGYGDTRTVSDFVDYIEIYSENPEDERIMGGQFDDAMTLIDNLIIDSDPRIQRGESRLLIDTVKSMIDGSFDPDE
jgi:hypothetical protein